jgi:hypothetical protein
MNKLEIIDKILQNEGNRLRESYFIKNSPHILDEILQYCNIITHLPFKQKIWHWVNDDPTEYLCKCGNPTTFNKNWKDGYRKYCSAKCSATDTSTKEKRKNTNVQKYGVDNVAKAEHIKNKQMETNLERYGTKSSAQNEEVKSKYKNTIRQKYGTQNYFESEDFKLKSRETLLERYGKEHFTKTEEYLEKTKNTNLEKYNTEWYTQTDEYKERAKQTNLENWGVEHLSKSSKFKKMVIERNLDKWGVEHYYQSEDFKEKSKETILKRYGTEYKNSEKYRNYLASQEHKTKIFQLRKKFYSEKGFDYIGRENDNVILYSDVCNHEFSIHPTNLERRKVANIEVCTICNPLNLKSGQHTNIVNFLIENGVELICNSRSQISPLELDIYIPSKSVAIEYNGLYWHSEIHKDKKYHLEKLLRCNEVGIDLIQVWEDDWLERQEIVKSIILSRLGLIQNKIGARKCQIGFIQDRNLVNNFFDNNHIQGKTNYKFAIGLFYNEELVSCMLFNKPKKDFELVRFANKINLTVSGAASRLFKYFNDNQDVSEIVSFADRATFNGNLYRELGFEFVHRTEPNFWWIVDGRRKHRFTYNKQKLIKAGGDPSKTEVEIMNEMGHQRIFGCGQDKYVYKKR